MPKQVVFALIIETALILLTLLLLTQPKLMFGTQSARIRSMANAGGMILLCLTFIWSVIFGCVLAINRVSVWL